MMMSKWPYKEGLDNSIGYKTSIFPLFLSAPHLLPFEYCRKMGWRTKHHLRGFKLIGKRNLFARAKEAQNTMLDSQRFRIRWRICWELFVWSFKKLIVTIIPAEEGRYCSWSGKFCCLRVYWGASDSFYIVLLSLHLYFCVLLFCISSSISWIRQVVCRLLPT